MSALFTPPREKKTSKAAKPSKKDKKKQSKEPQLEMEWKHVHGARTTSPLVDSPSNSPAFAKKPLRMSLSHGSYVTRRLTGQMESPPLSDGSRDQSLDHLQASSDSVHKEDEHDGPVIYRERTKSVLQGLTRSQSLEMLSDEHESYLLKPQGGPQV